MSDQCVDEQSGSPNNFFFPYHLGVLGMAGGGNKEEQFLLQVKPEYREKNAPVRFEASIASRLDSSLWGGRMFHRNSCLCFLFFKDQEQLKKPLLPFPGLQGVPKLVTAHGMKEASFSCTSVHGEVVFASSGQKGPTSLPRPLR